MIRVYGPSTACTQFGLSRMQLWRNLHKDREFWAPDAWAVQTTGDETPMWTEARIEEINEQIANLPPQEQTHDRTGRRRLRTSTRRHRG